MQYKKEHLLRLRKVSRYNRISRVYQKKAVKYGNVIEEFEYETPRITFTRAGERILARGSKNKKRSESSVQRARTMLYRLVEGNVNRHGRYKPVFVTLTFKENMQNLHEANYLYKLFIKRLNYFLEMKLKYITVPEWQKRGAIHYHTVFFNLPFIEKEKIEDIWSHGMTNIQIVKNLQSMGAYLAKYFSKACNDPRLFGERAYFTSRGLLRPEEIYGGDEVDNVIKNARIKKRIVSNYPKLKHIRNICKQELKEK